MRGWVEGGSRREDGSRPTRRVGVPRREAGAGSMDPQGGFRGTWGAVPNLGA